MSDYFVHESAYIDENVEIGAGTKIWHFCHIQKGARIGCNCSFGQNVNVSNNVKIGSGVKIQNNVSVYEGVELEDYVFCGPSMVFTNDLTPRAKYPKGSAGYKRTLVKTGATIGANATIVCGNTLGSWCTIAAGAVVTRDVPDHALMAGIPARQMGWVCECGQVLNEQFICPDCGRKYQLTDERLTEVKPMEFRDLKKQYQVLKNEIDTGIADVLASARFISGPQVKQLEEKLAAYVGAKHCICCANGTDAITLGLMAWNVGEGDAIFVPDFTFFSTGECPAYEGATPIYVDVERDSFNMDPAKLEEAIARVIAEGKYIPKAVIAVDLFGRPADYPRIRAICDQYGLYLMEDAAQGFGGVIDGKIACSFGDISTTSFFPAKPLGCYGDGGAIFTDNDEWAALIRSLTVHGKNGNDKYDNIRIGMNSRLDTLQAAILLPKLDAFEKYEVADVNAVAETYNRLLAGSCLELPIIPEGVLSSWAQYTVILPAHVNRAELQARMKEAGIPTMVYYAKPMHLQGAFTVTDSAAADCPVTEYLCSHVLSLPIHPYMEDADIELVCSKLLEYVNV